MRTDRLQREEKIAIVWHGFPLHPEIPEAGMELSELFAGSGYDLAAGQTRLLQVAKQEGIELVPRSRTSNSRRAQELSYWAAEIGSEGLLRSAIYRAFFVELRNIGQLDELLAIVTSAGLDASAAAEALRSGRYAAAVDADWERVRQLGIRGVPAYLCDGRMMTGFRGYEEYLQLVRG